MAIELIMNTTDETPIIEEPLIETPPESPSVGDTYLTGETPTGDWAEQCFSIVKWTGSEWEIYPLWRQTIQNMEQQVCVHKRGEIIYAQSLYRPFAQDLLVGDEICHPCFTKRGGCGVPAREIIHIRTV